MKNINFVKVFFHFPVPSSQSNVLRLSVSHAAFSARTLYSVSFQTPLIYTHRFVE